MTKFNTLLVITISLLVSLNGYAQKEYYNWYFGQFTGVTFNTSDLIPKHLNKSAITSYEGCSSISDKSGNTLFYTNGVTVWNKNHEIMVNGDSLLGCGHATQSSLIIKKPGDDSLYYIFTLDANCIIDQNVRKDFPYCFPYDGLNYSVVNIKLQNGSGEIIVKNIPLMAQSTEKLCGVKHCNKKDIWMIAHELMTNRFASYLIDDKGLNINPIYSNSGDVISMNDAAGYMKASPDGKKLALAFLTKGIYLFDFDNSTGIISNQILIDSSDSKVSQVYGLEFSPDCSKLYYSLKNQGLFIKQANLSAGTADDIRKSIQKIITVNDYDLYTAYLLGPDGKIYLTIDDGHYLNVISNPDSSGNNCNFKFNEIDLGMVEDGLPNILTDYYIPMANLQLCEGDTLILSTNTKAKSYKWTGPNGFTSIEEKPVVLNISPTMSGYYKVEIPSSICPFVDSCYITINTTPVTKISAPDTIIQCAGHTVKLQATTGEKNIKYKWSTGETTTSILAIKSGKYSLIVENDNHCTNYSEVFVQYLPFPKITILANTTFCESDSILLTAEPVDSNYIYLWSTGETTKQITIRKPGTYSVNVENSVGCTDSATITINPGLSANITASGPLILCKNGILALYSHPQGKNYTCKWSTGETSPNINVTVPGKYKVVITFNNNCIDSAEIVVGNGLAPVVSITPSGSTQFCAGDSISLKAMAAGTVYKWGSFYFENFNAKKSYPEWVTKVTNPEWQNPIKRDSSLDPKFVFLGIFGNQMISLNLKNLPVHDSAEISFDFFAIGTWDGCETTKNGPDWFKIDERNSNFHFYTSFSDFDNLKQAYPDTLPNCNNKMKTNSIGYYVITTSQSAGDVSVYRLSFRFPHSSDNVKLDLNAVLKDEWPILNNESWAFDNFRVSLRMVVPDTVPLKYLWSTGDTASTITASKSGDYKVIVENQSGCNDSASINVIVYPNPVIKFACKTSICPGDSIKITLTDKYESYLWSTQETTSSITVFRPDNFSVIVTDSNGCNGFGSITITQNPAAQFKIIGETSICKGSTAILSVDNDFAKYHWSTGDSTKEIIINNPGYYSLDVIDSNGCTGSAFKYLTQDSINYTGQIPFNFDDLCTGEQAEKEFTLKNWSLTDSLIISDIRAQTGIAFSLQPSKPLPTVLAALEETTVKVIFNPHEPINYSDSTVLKVIYPCNGIFKTELTGRGILKTKVWLPDTIAVIGTKGYNIPLFFQLTCGEKFPESISFTGEINYEASLMIPDDDNPLIANSSIISPDRVLSLKGSNIKIVKGNDSIGRFVTDILLANQNYTQLRFTKFDNDNYLIYTDKKDGSITIKGFCQFPISRLQAIGIKNFEVYVSNNFLITNYELLSSGDVHLSLFNQLGEEVKILDNGYNEKGEHNYQLPVNNLQLSSGLYFVRLVAAGEILIDKVIVVK